MGSLLSQTSVYDPHYQDLYSNATSPLKARLYVLFFFNVFWQLLRRSKSLRNRSTAQLPEEKTIADQRMRLRIYRLPPVAHILRIFASSSLLMRTNHLGEVSPWALNRNLREKVVPAWEG